MSLLFSLWCFFCCSLWQLHVAQSFIISTYTVKKFNDFPVPAGMSLTFLQCILVPLRYLLPSSSKCLQKKCLYNIRQISAFHLKLSVYKTYCYCFLTQSKFVISYAIIHLKTQFCHITLNFFMHTSESSFTMCFAHICTM